MRLNRHSVVFEVYNPYSIVQLSEVLGHVCIRRGERSIYTGKAVVTNLVSTGLMLIVSASLVDPWSDLVGLAPGPQLREEVGNFVHDWASSNRRLRPTYQVSVGNLRNFLQELSRWLEHGETEAGVTEPGTPPELQNEFAVDVVSTVSDKLNELFGTFEAEARQIPNDELAVHKAFARREVHPLLLCSPFMHRTYTKPLGYAGDYEMVNMILRDPYEGQNTYAKVINVAHLQVDVAKAHRNRIDKLTDYLVSEARRINNTGRAFRVLNVGCGPASEVQRYVENSWLADQTEFELLDFNHETLEYAEARISDMVRRHKRRTSLVFTHRSVHELLKLASRRGKKPGEPKFDLVYCAGLFDYLSDRICSRLLNLFYSWTLPSGLALVTNVHPHDPTRCRMEHLQEWSVLHRNEQQMLDLAPELGRQTVSMEAMGLNVFLEARKPDDQKAV